ncbi:stealth family protein [Alteromonas genovensis]|uniref:stealth family protein n=1 Tax=Alteromonas genovensis TaxID=471225 RepID=UPI002FDFD834
MSEEEIDFVILWVDGNDEVHKQQRRSYLPDDLILSASDAEQSIGANRFIQHNELRFCLRSIKCHAPWYRKIWLVTDRQMPPFLDSALLHQDRITIVDHKEIFRGKEVHLPTFNTRAIASQLNKISDLSNKFIYGNDDFMLASKTTPSFFFDDDIPKIWGDWFPISTDNTNTLFQQGMINAKRLIDNNDERYIHISHGFQPLTTTIINALKSLHPEEFENNLSYRFRHRSQFLLESLVNHYCHYKLNAPVLGSEPMIHFSFELCRVGDENKINFLFELLASGKRKMFCINEYHSLVSRLPIVEYHLQNLCGPKLLSEK